MRQGVTGVLSSLLTDSELNRVWYQLTKEGGTLPATNKGRRTCRYDSMHGPSSALLCSWC